jgi:ferredoxin-type protein NapH
MQIHDNKYKNIRRAGLVLFLAGFGLFLGVFFLSSYRLTEEALQQAIGYPENVAPNPAAQTLPSDIEAMVEPPALHQLVVQEAQPMLSETYTWNFRFVSGLRQLFKQTNEQVRQVYGISEAEIAQIVEAIATENNLSYEPEVAAQQLRGQGQLLKEKQQALKDYTGWMEGQSFETAEVLHKQLTKTVQNLNNSLLDQKGINSYAQRNIFQLA